MTRSGFDFTLPPPLRRGLRLRQLQLAVIVAVVAVRMMQVAVHEVIDVPGVRVMQMPVVQVIDVPVVLHCDVAAAGAVLMVVIGMDFAVAHNGGGLKLADRPTGAASGQGGFFGGNLA